MNGVLSASMLPVCGQRCGWDVVVFTAVATVDVYWALTSFDN